MKKLSVLLFIAFLVFASPASAVVDPLRSPNNKFGIHIIDENDLDSAAHLVNSSGGDWGYVTMVITEKDRNIEKWSGIFARLKDLHLIPLIRIATTLNSNYWLAPNQDESEKWAYFLNALPWPAKNRYIIVYNEPNHAKEWGGTLDPENYAEILSDFSLKLKSVSNEFYILPAGLDASAPNSWETMDEVLFLKRMISHKPEILSQIDGWTSHSYPNPHFSGKVSDIGRGTLRSFEWELNLLENLGLEKSLPVFITETGWTHNEDSGSSRLLTTDKVAENYVQADIKVWQSDNIVVVSPFLLNYQSYPFSSFSWQKTGSKEFYPQYDAYRSIPKTKGEPVRNTPTPTPTPLKFPLRLVKGIEAANSGTPAQNNDDLVTFLVNFIRRILS